MWLTRLSIENYRSIKKIENLRIERLQTFVGENNAGKSNILRAIDCFLSPRAGDVEKSDFNDPAKSIVIEAEFGGLSPDERKKLRSYLIGDRLILKKELKIESDPKTGKQTIETEYHGYWADPKDWRLSIRKIEEQGGKPDYAKIGKDLGITNYVSTPEGKVTKASYKQGLEKYLIDNPNIEYDDPVLGQTQALGIQTNLLSSLPDFYLLPAITDYSDEVDRRSTTTVFRRLMADLSDRLIRSDHRYVEIENALAALRGLLNAPAPGTADLRIPALGQVETTLRNTIQQVMPSVKSIQLGVEVEQAKEIFSKGVNIKVDDGVLTDVFAKGHGMQRSIVFSLLQMLINSVRAASPRPIILAIEEPELYIHPHSQRLTYNVLKEFAGASGNGGPGGNDQVIFTTHSPAFIDVGSYERIGVVRKTDVASGTVVHQCEANCLGSVEERQGFKLLTSFGLKHNELFFARSIILVEGPEDEIGIIATTRKLGRIKELPDEIGLSIVVTDGKGEMPKFQKLLNAFRFNYGALIELDGNPEDHKQTQPILQNINGNRFAKVPKRLEDVLQVGRHFDDVRHAKQFFSDYQKINAEMEALVTALLPPVPQ